MIELGVPFSDPLADGPIIQRAMERALARGTRLKDVLALAREIRAARPAAGLVIFSYLNPILRYGMSRFADDAAAAGVDGVLATDLIVEEAAEYLAEMSRAGLAPIFLAAPTSPDARLEAIATHSKGFVYAISRVGVTGTQQSVATDAAALVARIRRWADWTGLPVAVGFGISNANHVAAGGGVRGCRGRRQRNRRAGGALDSRNQRPAQWPDLSRACACRMRRWPGEKSSPQLSAVSFSPWPMRAAKACIGMVLRLKAES